jgi:outer membrane protein OmpA-like peptidoglycan-associated protein
MSDVLSGASARIRLVSLLFLTMLFSLAGQANEDIEGAGDHPLVERIAGSFITDNFRDEFKRVVLPAGPFDRSERAHTEQLALEGEWLKMIYRFDDPDISDLRVHRTFVQTLPEAGFELIFEGSDLDLIEQNTGRSADFLTNTSESYLLTNRGPLLNRQPVHYLLARSQDAPVHVAIATYQAPGPGGGTQYAITVVTEEEMEVATEHRPLSASEMEQGLMESGRVAIQDILFAFDSDEILAESSSSLATIAELMQEHQELGLLVVGHTDDVGNYDYNLRLSMERSTAVVRYLEQRHGIAGSRLRSVGAGMMAPIASNRTEAGRAQNRRVELVEMRD